MILVRNCQKQFELSNKRGNDTIKYMDAVCKKYCELKQVLNSWKAYPLSHTFFVKSQEQYLPCRSHIFR